MATILAGAPVLGSPQKSAGVLGLGGSCFPKQPSGLIHKIRPWLVQPMAISRRWEAHVALNWEDAMKRFALFGTAMLVSGLWLAAPAEATTQRCRNPQGHFIACPPPAHAAAGAPAHAAAGALPAGVTRDRNGRCHGAHGRFVPCPR